MCLAIAYKNEKKEENILMKNVSNVETENGFITLTDLMERKSKIRGSIIKADLIDNFILIRTEE